MRLVFLLAVLAGPAAAEDVWVLEDGPAAADTVPLKPVQPVDAWRGFYTDGREDVWVYATRSPNFFAPSVPEVRKLAGTPWTAAVIFPDSWKSGRRAAWLDAWSAEFLALSTFPQPGWPVVFPSVLKFRALTKD